MRQLAGPVLLLTLLVPALGCDKATPVAPTGTTLVISASPASIPTNTGSSTITVVARKANGSQSIGLPGASPEGRADHERAGVSGRLKLTERSGMHP